MGTDIKLKDLYNDELPYENISTVAIPKADNSGEVEFYVKRPVINYALLDPPTRELTATTDIYFASTGNAGNLLWGLASSQFLGVIYAPVEGKTTKPIGYMQIKGNTSGLVANPSPWNVVVYLYEELPGAVLLEVLNQSEGATDFTAQVGWGQLMVDADEKVTGYAKIDNPTAVTIGIEQPNDIQNADIFYSLLSEVTQEEQTVSVTENGEQTIVPTAGKSGIRKVALNVNVAGGGGGVQPDWNQNDSTAADFVKNRPGAYYETIPELTFTYDGNPVGKTVFDLGDGLILVKVSDTDLPTEEQFKQLNNSVKVHAASTGDTTVELGSSGFEYTNYYGALMWVNNDTGDGIAFVPSQETEIVAQIGIDVGVYFTTASNTEASADYIASFTCKESKKVVELPEALTEVKQSDWGATDGASSIINRIGGFFKVSKAGTVIEVADNAQWDYTFLGCEATKVLDYPLTAEELLMLQLTTVLDGGQEVTDALYLSNRLDNPTSDVYTLYRLNCIGVWVMKKSGHTPLFTSQAIVSCYGSQNIPAGTYVVRENTNSYVKKVTTYSTVQQKLPGALVRPNFIDQNVMAKSLILKSSSAGSNKTFLISVNDAGTLTATETILE